jgi:gamma-glutamyltranspeptidase/glutathione hydrolase
MDDFSMKPGVPNIYGLVGGEANAIAAGKRMLSSMTPTIVLEGGRVKLVLGSPGGSTIITTVMQVILNVLVHNVPLERAVGMPRFHHQWLPDSTRVESEGIPVDVLQNLERMGHNVSMVESLGDVHAVIVEVVVEGDSRHAVGDASGEGAAVFTGASDPRGSGIAIGY